MSEEKKYRYCLQIAYDGTEYSGWQVQVDAASIQGHLKRAFSLFLQEDVHPVGAGRTDAGVHAHAQVAHLDCSKHLNIRRAIRSINGILPSDIRVMSLDLVDEHFHARYSAKKKIYHYHICLNDLQNPFKRRYCYRPKFSVDMDVMIAASKKFIGVHDFTSFANEGHGDKSVNAVRELERFDIVEEEKGFYRLELESKGFLYKMVRNIVGMTLDVGRGKRSLEDIDSTFEARDRKQAGIAVPALGLFLYRVLY